MQFIQGSAAAKQTKMYMDRGICPTCGAQLPAPLVKGDTSITKGKKGMGFNLKSCDGSKEDGKKE
jgi:hypothetical protein